MEMNTTDWMQFYQGILSAQALGQVSDPQTVHTTTITSSTVTPPTIPATTSGGASSSGHLNADSPVSKPAKRRRASRAAPTTLINTDPSNFRAMVQQFTGVSNSSLNFGSQNDVHHIDFRAIQSTNFSSMARGEGHHNHHQQQQGYMFSLQNKRPKLDSSEDFFTGNTSQMFPRSTTSSSHNNNNRNQLIFIS